MYSLFCMISIRTKNSFKANKYWKSTETFLTSEKRFFTARDILGQRMEPKMLLFLAHRDIVYTQISAL